EYRLEEADDPGDIGRKHPWNDRGPAIRLQAACFRGAFGHMGHSRSARRGPLQFDLLAEKAEERRVGGGGSPPNRQQTLLFASGLSCASALATCIDENDATARASVNPLLRILWRAKSCSAKQNMQRWKPLYRLGRIGASLGLSSEGFDKQG